MGTTTSMNDLVISKHLGHFRVAIIETRLTPNVSSIAEISPIGMLAIRVC